MSELCLTCGMYQNEHDESQTANATSVVMMKMVSKTLPKEYADTLEKIVTEWRTHALPTCDPMAIE